MDPSTVFCATETCPDKGRVGAGNMGIHSQKRRRYRCHTCGDTFSATRGTPYYRLYKEAWLMTTVLILLAHGCPPQAIVAAFDLDERTVGTWLHRAGAHSQAVHAHLVETGNLDLGHVQADEVRVKVRGGVVWQAMAVALSSRLWLGGAVSRTRDGALVTRLLARVRACAASRAILLCGWVRSLRRRGADGLPGTDLHGQARASPAGVARGPHCITVDLTFREMLPHE